jgi:hypothetical protein
LAIECRLTRFGNKPLEEHRFSKERPVYEARYGGIKYPKKTITRHAAENRTNETSAERELRTILITHRGGIFGGAVFQGAARFSAATPEQAAVTKAKNALLVGAGGGGPDDAL